VETVCAGDHQPRLLINMPPDEDQAIVVVEEEVVVTAVPVAPARPAPNTGFSWVPFWIISAIVGILGVVLVWQPSSLATQCVVDDSAATE
jgi:hypothetical protein